MLAIYRQGPLAGALVTADRGKTESSMLSDRLDAEAASKPA